MSTRIKQTWQLGPGRIFYGWWMVFIATTLAALASGAYFSGFSAFFLPLTNEFNVSRGALSLVVAIGMIQTAVLGPFQGYLVDRFGPRRLMWGGVAMTGAGFILLSTAESFTIFAVYLIALIPLGINLGLTFPIATAIGNWFIKRRGTAFGIAMSGYGFGWAFVIGTNFLIESLGWRGASATLGVVIFAVGLPLASLVRHRPEQYGMLPDGEPQADEVGDTNLTAATLEEDFTAEEALRTPALWWILWAFSFRSFVNVALAVHFIPAVQDKGFSSGTAAAIFGLLGILSIPTRLANGLLSDVLDKRLVGVAQSAIMILAMIIFIWSTALWHLVVFVSIYAITTGGGGSLMYATVGEYYGRRSFGTIIGFAHAIAVIGSIIGPPFAGFAFDATGSYNAAFLGFAIAAAIATVMLLLVRRPARPVRSPAMEAID